MQIRKLQWINTPKTLRILSSRELSFKAEGKHALVYTYEEEQSLTIKFEKDEGIDTGIALILTPTAGVSLIYRGNKLIIESSVLNVKSTTYIKCDESLSYTVVKKENTLTFFFGDEEVYSFTFVNIKESVSIAAIIEGKGNVKLSFSTMTTSQL